MNAQPAPPSADQVADFYDLLGPLMGLVWDENYHFGYWTDPTDESSVAAATDRFTDLLVDKLGAGAGDRVLDVGCGVGKPALRIASATGARVLGISVNGAQVEEANARARAAGLAERVAFERADAMSMPFGAGEFRFVFALESIIHMDRPAAMREMARVLAPGGRLVLTDLTAPPDALAAAASAGSAADAVQFTSLVGLDDYPRLVADAGLKIVELLDVSEHTRKTVPRLAEGLLRHRKEFEERYGVDVQDLLDATTSPLIAVTDIGCLVLVATRE